MCHSSSSMPPRSERSPIHARACALTAVALAAFGPASREARASDYDLSSVSLPEAYRNPGPFGRALLLDANGDRRLDVVTTCGSVPVVIFSPSMSRTTLAIDACSAIEVAVWPGVESDDVLASTASGITRFRYGDTFGGGRPGYLATALLGAPFERSTSLAVVDLDGDGDLDLAALSANGRHILRAYGDTSGGLTPAAPLVLDAPMEHMVVTPWGAGTAFALTRGNRLRVVNGLGAPLDGFVFSGPIADLAPVREGASASRALAVLTSGSGGASRVTVVRAGGALEAALDLGTMGAFALYAADVDGSGFEDLVVTGRADGYLRVVRHSGAAPNAYRVSDVSFVEVQGEAVDPSAQASNALAADLDRDGDIDLFHLAEATRAGVLARDTAVAHLDYAPELIAAHIVYGGPAPHAVVDVLPRLLRSGALPTQVGVELWSELPGGPTFYGGRPLSFPLGRALVNIDPLDPGFVVRIDAPRSLGERAWILLRGFEAGGTALEVGTDEVVQFERSEARTEGGGGGSTTGGQNGDATTPPPKDVPPVGSGG